MKTDILTTLEHSRNLIISPDMDGFMSAKLIERFNGSKIVGSYDKNIYFLSKPPKITFRTPKLQTPIKPAGNIFDRRYRKKPPTKLTIPYKTLYLCMS